MTDYRVDCITKPDRTSRRERIQRLGGNYPHPWNDTEDNVIAAILRGDTFHVVRNGARVAVIIAYHGLMPYLKTEADGLLFDNLLALPECGR